MLNTLNRYRKALVENLGQSGQPLKVFDVTRAGDTDVWRVAAERDPDILESAIGRGAQWFDHPAKYAVVPGGIVANQLLGNPVGSISDSVFGTDFTQDALPGDASIPKATALPPSYKPITSDIDSSIPALSADDLRRQVDYYQRRIRTDLETLKVLENQKYQANLLGTE